MFSGVSCEVFGFFEEFFAVPAVLDGAGVAEWCGASIDVEFADECAVRCDFWREVV